ncbi:MAG: hypothetical protein K8M05_41595, partial [Deltaproteobacteria bacterium]|nr:hypothetical protein [Kofleriaceae bacterium]
MSTSSASGSALGESRAYGFVASGKPTKRRVENSPQSGLGKSGIAGASSANRRWRPTPFQFYRWTMSGKTVQPVGKLA